MINMVLGWLIAALVAAGGAYVFGRKQQQMKNKNNKLEHVVKTMKEVEEIENEIQQRSDAKLLDDISK